MATTNPTRPSASAPTFRRKERNRSTDVAALQQAIEAMDAHADGVSEIGSIARLCVQALQSPDPENGRRYIADVVMALRTMEEKAFDVRNSINCTAEEVGCNYIDENRAALRHARHAYIQTYAAKCQEKDREQLASNEASRHRALAAGDEPSVGGAHV